MEVKNNMKTNILFRIGAIVAFLIAIAIAASIGSVMKFASASAPPGAPAVVNSMASTSVNTPTVTQIAATSTCTARTISTSGASAVMLGFSAFQGTTTTGSFGMYQAASTTVTYDSGQFGCGQISAFSYATSTVNTLTTQ